MYITFTFLCIFLYVYTVKSGEQSNIENDYDRDQRNHNEDGEYYVDDKHEQIHHRHHHHHDFHNRKVESQNDDHHTHVETHHDNHNNNKNNNNNKQNTSHHDHARVDPSLFIYQQSPSSTYGGGDGRSNESRDGDSGNEVVSTYILCDCCCYGVFNPCCDFINSMINCCGCCDFSNICSTNLFSMINCCGCDASNICSANLFSMINCCDISSICSSDIFSILNCFYDNSHVCISCLSDLPLRSICESLFNIFRNCVE
jgi:hypothetical protein